DVLLSFSALASWPPTVTLISGEALMLRTLADLMLSAGLDDRVALRVLFSPRFVGSASISEPLARLDTAVDALASVPASVLWTALPLTPMRLTARSFGIPGSAGRAAGRCRATPSTLAEVTPW